MKRRLQPGSLRAPLLAGKKAPVATHKAENSNVAKPAGVNPPIPAKQNSNNSNVAIAPNQAGPNGQNQAAANAPAPVQPMSTFDPTNVHGMRNKTELDKLAMSPADFCDDIPVYIKKFKTYHIPQAQPISKNNADPHNNDSCLLCQVLKIVNDYIKVHLIPKILKEYKYALGKKISKPINDKIIANRVQVIKALMFACYASTIIQDHGVVYTRISLIVSSRHKDLTIKYGVIKTLKRKLKTVKRNVAKGNIKLLYADEGKLGFFADGFQLVEQENIQLKTDLEKEKRFSASCQEREKRFNQDNLDVRAEKRDLVNKLDSLERIVNTCRTCSESYRGVHP